jgi:hypothetical protein
MSAESVSPITPYFRVCDGVRVRFADTKAMKRNSVAVVRDALEPGEDWSWCYLDEVAFVLDGLRGMTRIPPSPLLN